MAGAQGASCCQLHCSAVVCCCRCQQLPWRGLQAAAHHAQEVKGGAAAGHGHCQQPSGRQQGGQHRHAKQGGHHGAAVARGALCALRPAQGCAVGRARASGGRRSRKIKVHRGGGAPAGIAQAQHGIGLHATGGGAVGAEDLHLHDQHAGQRAVRIPPLLHSHAGSGSARGIHAAHWRAAVAGRSSGVHHGAPKVGGLAHVQRSGPWAAGRGHCKGGRDAGPVAARLQPMAIEHACAKQGV